MPHDRLRFAWIVPPRAVWLPRRSVRQEQQPKQKGPATTPAPVKSRLTSGAQRTFVLAAK